MPSTAPTRVDEDLFESAKHAAAFTGRSAAQQLAYWARVGREVEASSAISIRRLEGRLAGARTYDDLEPDDQARLRAEWAEGIGVRLRKIDFAAAFRRFGVPWIGVDADGEVVRRVPRGFDPARVADDTRAALGIREAASDDVLAALARAEARLAAERADGGSGLRHDEEVRKVAASGMRKAVGGKLGGRDRKPTRGQTTTGGLKTEKSKVVRQRDPADGKPAGKKSAVKQASTGSRPTVR